MDYLRDYQTKEKVSKIVKDTINKYNLYHKSEDALYLDNLTHKFISDLYKTFNLPMLAITIDDKIKSTFCFIYALLLDECERNGLTTSDSIVGGGVLTKAHMILHYRYKQLPFQKFNKYEEYALGNFLNHSLGALCGMIGMSKTESINVQKNLGYETKAYCKKIECHECLHYSKCKKNTFIDCHIKFFTENVFSKDVKTSFSAEEQLFVISTESKELSYELDKFLSANISNC